MPQLYLPPDYRENPLLSPDEKSGGYWNTSRGDTGALWQADVYRFVARKTRPDDTVVDIGCGIGVKLERFVSPVAGRTIGVDQESGIAIARRRAPHLEWVAGDLNQDDVWDEISALSPDIVVCADVVEHVADPFPFLERLRTLTQQGVLFISTPDRDRLYGPSHNGPPRDAFHVREWNADEFRSLLQDAGLHVESIHHLLTRDRRPIHWEAMDVVWKVLHAQRPGRRESCMMFVCRTN